MQARKRCFTQQQIANTVEQKLIHPKFSSLKTYIYYLTVYVKQEFEHISAESLRKLKSSCQPRNCYLIERTQLEKIHFKLTKWWLAVFSSLWLFEWGSQFLTVCQLETTWRFLTTWASATWQLASKHASWGGNRLYGQHGSNSLTSNLVITTNLIMEVILASHYLCYSVSSH